MPYLVGTQVHMQTLIVRAYTTFIIQVSMSCQIDNI